MPSSGRLSMNSHYALCRELQVAWWCRSCVFVHLKMSYSNAYDSTPTSLVEILLTIAIANDSPRLTVQYYGYQLTTEYATKCSEYTPTIERVVAYR
jgi:hypothetical protein